MVTVSPARIDDREPRLLEAAAKLFERLGYDKTTIGDVAAEAGVSKGSVYLSFDSKQDLFETLLLFQMRDFAEAWFARVEAHPRGGTVGAMYEAMLFALDDCPFMGMIFRRDRGLLGRYLQQPDNFFIEYSAGQATRHEALALMQEAGAIREDVDPKVAAHIMNMFVIGLLSDDPRIPAAEVPPTDDLIRGIADFMDRALTPADGGNSEAGKAVLRALFEGGRAQFAKLIQNRRAAKKKDSGR